MDDRNLLEFIAAQVGKLTQDVTDLKQGQARLENKVLHIEQNHGQKLDALFDGYKQNSEKLDRMNSDITDLKEGQTRLEQSQAKLEQSQARLEQSQAKLEQSQARLEQSQTRLEQSQAKLEQSQARLEQGQCKIENNLLAIEQNHGQKLDALFDGYKLNSDKLDRIEQEVSKQQEIIIKRVK